VTTKPATRPLAKFFSSNSPANTHVNPLEAAKSPIHNKTKEKNLLRKWHTSYPQPDKIEVVEIKKREARRSSSGFSPFAVAVFICHSVVFV
jgi:hypothetical protein